MRKWRRSQAAGPRRLPPVLAGGLLLLAAGSLPAEAVPAGPAPRAPRLDLRRAPAPPSRLLQPRIPGTALSAPSDDPAELVARRFVASRLAPPGELALVSVVTGGGGVRFVTLEQRFDSRPVAAGRVGVAIAADGSVLAARLGELAPAAPRRPSGPRRLHGAEAAWARALELVAPARKTGAAKVLVERVWLATAEGAVPAWRVRLLPSSDPFSAQELVLGERDGRLLRREAAGFGAVRARVFPQDPSRGSVLVTLPDPATEPSIDSPAGWLDSSSTAGNNVEAHLEWGTLLSQAGPAPSASGDPLLFDFPFSGDPAADRDAAVTNVFWALNEAHDRFRALGFDEASGALQDDGFGRGGVDGDRLHALVQYASYDGTEPYNAIASAIGADGTPSFLAVGLFELPSGELRDGAFETDLLFHEYGHAVSTRLFGGEPLCLGGAQPAALLEGWSDFFAASFTDDPVLGAWTSGNAVSGQRSAALDRNGLSLLNFCAGGCDPFRDGEIWAATLWDLRDELRTLHGEDEGTRLAERLALEAMRYAPCRPTLLDARDAVLLADAALSSGAHHCLAWGVFAGRGLGASAGTTGPDDPLPEPGFDLPPQCAAGASLSFDLPEYGTDAEAVLELVDGTGTATGTALRVSSSGGDAEDVALSPVPGGPLLRASVTLVSGAPLPGDGILQVQAGATLSASHAPTGAAASAAVSEAMGLLVVTHRITDSSCQSPGDDDHADAPDWDLPGFLDAGENADLTVFAANLTEAPLIDAEVLVTSGHPGVDVVSSGWIPLGTIPPQDRGFGRLFSFTVGVSAAPSVTAGETATLGLSFRSRGRSGNLPLALPLNLDYVVERGLSPFRAGVETFERDSWSVLDWSHEPKRPGADDWRLSSCAASSGGFSYGNVRADCSSYSEDQAAALLLSPPLFSALPADAAAWRFAELAWDVRSDLYTDPGFAFCDADLVGAFFTADPDTLPYDDPTNIFNYGPLRAYWFADNDPDWYGSGPYGVDTSPQAVPAGLDQVRLAFVFWNEIFGIDDCGFETLNDGSFHLDDVRFSYDLVRVVPEATPCSADCTLRLVLEASPPEPKCAGEAFELDASGTSLSGCAGRLLFRYEGPGVPPGYEATTEMRAPAVAQDDGTWTVTATCEGQPDCRSVRTIRNPAPQAPGLGGPHPESLRVSRAGGDLLLDWWGAALPPTYGAFEATERLSLEAGVAAWPLVAAVDSEGPRGEGRLRLPGAALAPGLSFLRVLARDPCTERPRPR